MVEGNGAGHPSGQTGSCEQQRIGETPQNDGAASQGYEKSVGVGILRNGTPRCLWEPRPRPPTGLPITITEVATIRPHVLRLPSGSRRCPLPREESSSLAVH